VNIDAIDLNLLKVLDALLEERHVSRAAQRVGLSQPALSNALRRLREVCEDPLFTRSRQGMVPTARALQMGGPVRGAMRQIREALSGGAEFDPGASVRTFRIAMPDYLEYRLMPGLLRALATEAPEVRVQVRRLEGLFQAPETALRAGSLDLAVGFFPDGKGVETGTRVETLFSDRQAVIGRSGHPLLRGRGVMALEKFVAAEHAAVIFRDEAWGLIDTELASQGLRRRMRLATPHFLTALRAVQQSDLIACVPEWLAREFAGEGLAVRKPPFHLPEFVARMVWSREAEADPGQRWFRGMALRNFAAGADG
jgi:DNA-binding transcriptional LysR family regulator